MVGGKTANRLRFETERESDSRQQHTVSRTRRLLRFENAIEIDKLSTARVFIHILHILIAPSSFSSSSYIVMSARVITSVRYRRYR